MNFTKQAPGEPGVYMWRWRRSAYYLPRPVLVNQQPEGLEVFIDGIIQGYTHTIGGEWCRLVPEGSVIKLQQMLDEALAQRDKAEAEATKLREEVQRLRGARIEALQEALELSVRGLPPLSCRAILNAKIEQAKRVAEGKE